MPGGHDTEYSARGAALLAALAVDGDVPAVAAGRGSEPAPPVAEPDPSRAAVWDGLWASCERARRAVTRYYHAGYSP
jgi:hypothetical protein